MNTLNQLQCAVVGGGESPVNSDVGISSGDSTGYDWHADPNDPRNQPWPLELNYVGIRS